MKYSVDFKKEALAALKGRWGTAVLAGFLATLLGAITNAGADFEWEERINNVYIDRPEIVFLIVLAALVAVCAFLVLGSVVGVGYARFQLNLTDRNWTPTVGTLFSCFDNWKTTLATRLLKGLYVSLWTLLLIVPGIIASYSYSMTDYLLAEHPEMTAREAIRRSKEMMKGNRGRLFCLQISFIGWGILSALTLGIGNLWLTPYRQAAQAAFYLDLVKAENQDAPEVN